MTQQETTTQGHTPGTLDCGCKIHVHRLVATGGIIYCPLHAAAPETAAERDWLLATNAELLEVAKRAVQIRTYNMGDEAARLELQAAIAAAQVTP